MSSTEDNTVPNKRYFLLFLLQNKSCDYSLELSCWCDSSERSHDMFRCKKSLSSQLSFYLAYTYKHTVRLQSVYFYLLLLYKSTCCRYSFELFWQVEAIETNTTNICFYKNKIRKKNINASKVHRCPRHGDLHKTVQRDCSMNQFNNVYEGCSKWIAYCPLARYPRGAR